MLEAILFLRWGVVLSSVPKEKLESPPGGRSTLWSNKMTQFWRQLEWHPTHHAPISPPLPLHNLSLQTETQGLHVTHHWSDARRKNRKKKKDKINSEIKHEVAPSYMQPSLYSTLFFYKHTTQEREKKKPMRDTSKVPPLSKPRLSACQTDSPNLCPAADSSRT